MVHGKVSKTQRTSWLTSPPWVTEDRKPSPPHRLTYTSSVPLSSPALVSPCDTCRHQFRRCQFLSTILSLLSPFSQMSPGGCCARRRLVAQDSCGSHKPILGCAPISELHKFSSSLQPRPFNFCLSLLSCPNS